MFECKSCIARCIRAVGSEASNVQNELRKSLVLTPRLTSQSRRGYASANVVSGIHDGLDKAAVWAEHPMVQSKPPRNHPDAHATSNRRALQTEMRYLTDPVKFAEHVHYTLRCNQPEKALELCRLASKGMNCVVAWNHTINWFMKKERKNEAIKIYNEMKKRGQFPDSYTYVLLLRGFPQYRTHHAPEAKREVVAQALSIYRSMSSPNSRAKPSIIHTNAVLRVCALAREMDALWEIVSQLPETGPNSADCITYTILLSAIRHTAFDDHSDISARQTSQSRDRVINEGKRIWQDIVVRWRGGEVLIDEQLVCAMGNLLLVSKRIEDWDDVLNLIQQTTNIRRLLPPLGSPGRHIEHVPVFQEVGAEDATDEAHGDDTWTPTPANNAFKSIEPYQHATGKSRRSGLPTWVRPGNAILSIIVEACSNMQSAKTVNQYWDLLVGEHGLVPDRANYQALLRLLRINRNSARAASVIQEMTDRGVEMRNQTFRIALSVCARNPKNPNVFNHARSIVDQMYQSQSDPDVPTLEQYLDLARILKDGSQLASVLDKLEATMDALASRIRPGIEVDTADNNTATSFFRVVIGAIDTLCQDASMPKEDTERWKAKRMELDRHIGQATNNLEHRKQRESRRPKLAQQAVGTKRPRHKRNPEQ